jgi:RND superfamily putative drug exporter
MALRGGSLVLRAPRRVVIAWLVLLALVGGGAALVMRPMDDSFRIPGASSQAAYDQLRMTFPEAADAGATMIVTLPAGRDVADADVRKVSRAASPSSSAALRGGSISPSEPPRPHLGRRPICPRRLRLSGSVSTITDGQRDPAARRLEAEGCPASGHDGAHGR